MHFWKNKDIIVIFHGKKFEFNYDDKSLWTPAVEHGLGHQRLAHIAVFSSRPNERIDLFGA